LKNEQIHAQGKEFDMTTPERFDEKRWQICLSLARGLLLVDVDGADLKHRYLKALIDEGLPKTTAPLRVLIVGAADGAESLRLDCWKTNLGLHKYYLQHGFDHLGTRDAPGHPSGALFERPTDLQLSTGSLLA